MKKKGFTLIELLAVIVILAVILTIAVPAVKKTVDSAKQKTAENDAIMIKGIAEKYYAANLDSDEEITGIDLSTDTLSYSGEKPTKGYLYFTEDGIAYGKMYINGYCVEIKSDGTNTSEKVSIDDCNIADISTGGNTSGGNQGGSGSTEVTKTYTNGEVAYFDVKNGVKCSEENYHVDNSKTGYNGITTTTSNQNGCMKFYAFNDSGEDKVNLILDHNTTATIKWNSQGTSVNGPKEVLEQLKTDTSAWKGTLSLDNYSMDQSSQSSGAKYTINYSGYKARLITANEVAKITGNTSFNEVSQGSNYIFFETNSSTYSNTCYYNDDSKNAKNLTNCTNRWLADRTHLNSTSWGSYYDSDVSTMGYWTASSNASDNTIAWSINFGINNVASSGSITAIYMKDCVDNSFFGVRPVIEVSRALLK